MNSFIFWHVLVMVFRVLAQEETSTRRFHTPDEGWIDTIFEV